MLAGIATKPFMASLLFKADKMKQRLQKSFSCSSSASTSVVAFSSGRLTAPPSSTMSSSTKLKKKKKTTASPASSSRFLLNSSRLQLEQSQADVTTLDSLPPLQPPSVVDFFPSSSDDYQQIAEESSRLHRQQQAAITRRSCSTATSRSQEHHQVVVLKVSLHCKGCAGKVKKHISKMEGVTSFDIDMATKKVTVMGNVTPLGVLNCISKVKSAQFWPASPPRASASF